MKRYIALTTIVLLVSSVSALAGDPSGKVYGAGVTLEETVAIEALLAEPESFVGKSIRVDGVITGVCKMRGCWMKVSDPETGDGVRIKVEDGVIVFPYTAMGNKASAEGVFEAIPVAVEEAKHKEKAAEQGEDHEACTEGAVKKKDVIYQIRGTGAVVYSAS